MEEVSIIGIDLVLTHLSEVFRMWWSFLMLHPVAPPVSSLSELVSLNWWLLVDAVRNV